MLSGNLLLTLARLISSSHSFCVANPSAANLSLPNKSSPVVTIDTPIIISKRKWIMISGCCPPTPAPLNPQTQHLKTKNYTYNMFQSIITKIILTYCHNYHFIWRYVNDYHIISWMKCTLFWPESGPENFLYVINRDKKLFYLDNDGNSKAANTQYLSVWVICVNSIFLIPMPNVLVFVCWWIKVHFTFYVTQF